MKKNLILVITLVALGLGLQAQESKKEAFKSKRGVYILPEAGDIALGFDATPFLKYAGNLMNGHSGNSLSYGFPKNNAIIGKYFLDDNTAIRGELRLGFDKYKDREFILKDGSDPADKTMVTDSRAYKQTDIHLAGGYEMRRGHGRVQGFYGAMAELRYDKTNIDYTYGNPITSTYTTPATTDFGENMLSPSSRVTNVKDLQNLNFGVYGFIGVEYFFAPKISLGAEFSWGPSITALKKGELNYEYWDGTNIKTETVEIAKDSKFNIDNDARGQIFLLFHF